MSNENQKFTYEEVAAVLGVSRQTVYNYQKEGIIPEAPFDMDKLTVAVEAVTKLKEEETRHEVEKIRRRFRVHETGFLAVA